MRRPPEGDVWLHIDKINKPRNVWAVQYWDKDGYHYRVANHVAFTVGETDNVLDDDRTPRAWLVFKGAQVVWTGKRAAIVNKYFR